ncbi:MAG TPA: glycosyltransferase family 2 protein [Candidatus Obscuribacterales bacterium]
MNISVVVPVYNSSKTLPDLVAALHPVLDELAHEYELILVNDGSRDESAQVMERLSRLHSWIRPINFMRNYGQHSALLCGIRAARYEITVTIDDDLQNPPEEIPKLVAKLQKGYDVVYGVPVFQQHGLARNLASHVTKVVLQGAMGARNASDIRSFRAIRTQLREAFAGHQSPFVNIDALLAWGTSRFSSVRIRHDPRQDGQSNYTFGKLVTHAINMITGFSTLPLRLATIYGFLCVLFGFAVLAFVVVRYLTEGDCVQGFPFLASIIVIFAGAQLFSLGIIGEYMSRIYLRTMARPPYVVCSESRQEESRVAVGGSSWIGS